MWEGIFLSLKIGLDINTYILGRGENGIGYLYMTLSKPILRVKKIPSHTFSGILF